MIILQKLAAIVLIPLTGLLLILFNVYSRHWLYFLLIGFFVLIYSFFWGLVFVNSSIAAWVFMLFCILYVIRIGYLACKLSNKSSNKNYPLVKGKISSSKHKFYMIFFLHLGFLNIFTLFPNYISRKLSEKTKLNIEIPKLINLILVHSRGTRIEVNSDEADIYFEIQ